MKILIIVLIIVPAFVFAQEPAVSPTGDFFLNTVGSWLLGFFTNNPGFAGFLAIMGFLRLILKPTMTILQAYVKMTPYDNDDKWLASVESSKGYKLLIYLLDWILSVKLPGKP